jgi:hypothetical protein
MADYDEDRSRIRRAGETRPDPPQRDPFDDGIWSGIKQLVSDYVRSRWNNLLEKVGLRARDVRAEISRGGQPSRPKSIWRTIKRSCVLAFGLLFVFYFLMLTFTKYIQPWDIGIKQVKWGSHKGFEKKIYVGGLRHFMWPWQEVMHTLPINLQFTYIHTVRDKAERLVAKTGLEVPTTDGSTVNNDIIVIWRMYENSEYDEKGELIHGGPWELRDFAGLDYANWERLIIQTAEDRCKRALGSLSTTLYYKSPILETKTDLATKWLNDGWTDQQGTFSVGWKKRGIEIVAVLPGAYYFEKNIHEGIKSKNMQVQEAALNSAMEKFSENKAKVEKVQAEGSAAIVNKEIWGKAEAIRIKSEGELFERTKDSEGRLLEENAVAQATNLKSKALEDLGSNLYVAQKLAKMPMTIKGGIISGINPLDPSAWMNLTTGEGGKK